MREANAIVRELRSPLVRFDEMSGEIFLHESSLILFHTQYDDGDGGSRGTLLEAHENGGIINHPIDENGEIHSLVTDCPIIGRAGDTISPFNEVIMSQLKTLDYESIPRCYERVKDQLDEYGIGIRGDVRESLKMSIFLKDSPSVFLFESGGFYSRSLPFMHTYMKEEFSDELLAEDIAATLRALFSVLPAPTERLVLGVGNVDGSMYNENVVRLLNESGGFGFGIVTPTA